MPENLNFGPSPESMQYIAKNKKLDFPATGLPKANKIYSLESTKAALGLGSTASIEEVKTELKKMRVLAIVTEDGVLVNVSHRPYARRNKIKYGKTSK